MYKKTTIEDDTQRFLTMDRWYVLDGRHRSDHPLHGSYAGLQHIGPLLDQQNDMED
tara:strand:+ start:290 stop:457 length:168 start_codon:yes stop_codon:yes gene_type:complete